MKTKTIDVEIKAVGEGGEGRFQAYASVFGNVDSYGDKVVQGAFADTLAEFAKTGVPIPLYWRHRMDDPMLNLGGAVGTEDSHGLLVDCQLDMELETAQQVFKLLVEKRVRQMSFAYDVLEGGWVETEDDGSFYELRKLRLHEVSIVPVGANQDTEILAVKSAVDVVVAGVKAGRELTTGDIDEAKAALAELSSVIPTEEQADEPSDAKAEEPEEAKAEEPSDVPHARAKAVNQLVQTL